jgi:hypothetical protein
MRKIDEASKPLALIMRREGATWWEPGPDGGYLISGPKKGRGSRYVDLLVSPENLEAAEYVEQHNMLPWRGALDLKPVIPNRPRSVGKGKSGPRKHRD